MIGHKEDNNLNDDSECDNKRDDNKNNIDVVYLTCSETTEGTQFDTLLEMVADLGRSIFRLFQVQTSSHWIKIMTVIQLCLIIYVPELLHFDKHTPSPIPQEKLY